MNNNLTKFEFKKLFFVIKENLLTSSHDFYFFLLFFLPDKKFKVQNLSWSNLDRLAWWFVSLAFNWSSQASTWKEKETKNLFFSLSQILDSKEWFLSFTLFYIRTRTHALFWPHTHTLTRSQSERVNKFVAFPFLRSPPWLHRSSLKERLAAKDQQKMREAKSEETFARPGFLRSGPLFPPSSRVLFRHHQTGKNGLAYSLFWQWETGKDGPKSTAVKVGMVSGKLTCADAFHFGSIFYFLFSLGCAKYIFFLLFY